MDQFSHDLTVALEETSRLDNAIAGKWGQRRRTRSTGNLPCAPQPTEDSSSSPADNNNDANNSINLDGLSGCLILTDSDEKQEELRLPIKTIHFGNFESDSVNENFSPARLLKQNTRRKRKFKRMAVEYQTAPLKTPPSVTGENTSQTLVPLTGTIKKRFLKHSIPDNYRTNLFFCGKRKRSHRDRYHEHDHTKLHSSSVPRQSYNFPLKNSYQDCQIRPRSFSSASKPQCERILPLNKCLISKIEKISMRQQEQQEHQQQQQQFPFKVTSSDGKKSVDSFYQIKNRDISQTTNVKSSNILVPTDLHRQIIPENSTLGDNATTFAQNFGVFSKSLYGNRKQKYRSKREQIKIQLQFDDQNLMECGELNDFLSSSSLSSSESEDEKTNDSDREGDDELTDWPGNEAVGNCDSKNEFKRKLTKKSNLPLIRSDENTTVAEDDTLMSGEEQDANEMIIPSTSTKIIHSAPIAIKKCFQDAYYISGDTMDDFRIPIKQIESEMSGETSNPFLASPPCQPDEVREIRAGCRRIKGERPSFSIKTSVNERLARFLQDARQSQIRLPEIEIYEHESLTNLAKLYSLQMAVDNGCAVLTKTSNTTQSVQIDRKGLQNHLLYSDFKRRCYDGGRDCSGNAFKTEEEEETTTTTTTTNNLALKSDDSRQNSQIESLDISSKPAQENS